VRFSDLGLKFGLALIVMIGTACATQPRPTIADPTASMKSDEPLEASSTRASPVAIELPEPGRPFDAATLLAAMRESTRPGGVPDEIETDVIAAALADAIWTFDGRPWTTTAASGSCGPDTCTLEVAGARTDMTGDDLWVFSVTPTTGSVEVVSAEMRSLPDEVAVVVDQLVRALDADGSLSGMIPTSLKWLSPPDDGTFVASYRSGGEEGSCGVDVTLDANEAVIVSEQSRGC
jgi:hypothetical protein